MTEQREGNALCPWCRHQLLNSQPTGVPIAWRNALSLLHQTFWVVVLLLAAKCILIAIILFLSSFTWFISHSCWGDECQTAWFIRTFICVIYIPSLGRYTDCLFLCFSSLHGLMCLNQNVTKAQAVKGHKWLRTRAGNKIAGHGDLWVPSWITSHGLWD